MDIEFDQAKDEANIAKHGVSLSRAAELEFQAVLRDDRFQTEVRFRGYGSLDGAPYCVAFTMRGTVVRVISLRRARAKEMLRYLP